MTVTADQCQRLQDQNPRWTNTRGFQITEENVIASVNG